MPSFELAAQMATEFDASIDELPPDRRARIADEWEALSEAELRVAGNFSVIAGELLATGADRRVQLLVATAVSDEVRHAEICRAVATRYRGAQVPWPKPAPLQIPIHHGAPASLIPTLHVIGMCCVAETLGSAQIEHRLRRATAPVPRAAIHALLTDEVNHARAGFAHLASDAISAEMRVELVPWLVRVLRGNVGAFVAAGEVDEWAEPEHGFPPRAEMRRAAVDAVDAIVLPGFAHAGLDAQAAIQWWRGHRS